jgi:hypothetical protein
LNFQSAERFEEASELGNYTLLSYRIQLILGKILENYVDREIIGS